MFYTKHYQRWAFIFILLWMQAYAIIAWSMLDERDDVQFLQIPRNQSVTIGETVRFECVPSTNVKYVIWYFQSLTGPNEPDIFRVGLNSRKEREPEPVELAVCQPNVLCKEKHDVPGLTIYPNGQLTIDRVSFEHGGKYECAVVAGVHASRVHAHLFVETEPSIPFIEVVSSHMTAKKEFREGDSLRLICTCTQGFPIPQLFWMKTDLKRIENNSKSMVTIQSDSPRLLIYTPNTVPTGSVQLGLLVNLSWQDHNSEFLCKAINRIGAQLSNPYRISVTYSPRIRPFRFNPWVVVRDVSTQLLCDSDAHPSPDVHWKTQDGKELMSSSILDSNILVAFVLANRGAHPPSWRTNITCVATNILGMAQRSLTIEVQSSPVVVTNRFVYARIGQSIRLHCEAVSNPPVIRVFWDRQNTHSENTTVSSLRNQTYNNYDSVRSGDDSHYWFSPTLQINSISQDDAGTYRCVAENIVHASGMHPQQKQSEDFSTIYVYYPPKPPLVSTHFPSELIPGVSLKLDCQPNVKNPGLPVPSLRWKWRPRTCSSTETLFDRSTKQTVWNSLTTESSVLTIPVLQPRDNGFYSCEARNGMGEASSPPVAIEVNVPPKIVEHPVSFPPDSMSGILTPNKRFRCVARGNPAPKLTWKHNGRVLSNDSKGMVAFIVSLRSDVRCLQLTHEEFIWETRSDLSWESANLTSTDVINQNQPYWADVESDAEGTYVCEATNRVGTASSATVRLNLQYTPKRMHGRILKQALTRQKNLVLADWRRSTELLNDPPPASTFASVAQRALPDRLIYCIMRSNPPSTRLAWHYVLDENQCGGSPGYTNQSTCECTHAQLLVATEAKQNTIAVGKSQMYRAQIIRGLEAEAFISSVIGKLSGYDLGTTLVAQLLFNGDQKPPHGTYMATLTNPLGCEVCLVQLQEPSLPEDISNVQVENITWHAVLLTWQTGFDGGLEQEIVMERLKLSETARAWLSKDSFGQMREQLRITNIPKLPAEYRCWLHNLEPNMQYQFLLHTENELGRSKNIRKIDVKTAVLDFPQLERVEPFRDRVDLYFKESNTLVEFCVQIELAHSPFTQWLQFYDDCPILAVSTDNSSEIQHVRMQYPRWSCQVSILSNPHWFWINEAVEANHSQAQDVMLPVRMTQITESQRNTIINYNPLKVKRTGSLFDDLLNVTQPNEDITHLANEGIQYRIRTCLQNHRSVCSPEIIYSEVDSTRSTSLMSLIWVCAGVASLFILSLVVCGCVCSKRKRQQAVTERVWIRRDQFSRNGDGGSSRGRKVIGSQRQPIITSSFESPTDEDLKLIELSKISSNEPPFGKKETSLSSLSQIVQTISVSPTVPTVVSATTPTLPFDIVHSISTTSGVGPVTPCSLLLNSATVGPGAQVLSPIFSVANASDLIRDVDGIGPSKVPNPASSVLLIPATQLSTVGFSAKAAEDDPVSLILHIPVQANPSS